MTATITIRDYKTELAQCNERRMYLVTMIEQISDTVVSIEINTLHDSFIYEHSDSELMKNAILKELKQSLKAIEQTILDTVNKQYGHTQPHPLG